MCGIVGAVLKANGGFFKKQEDSFIQLLFADQLRGEDSTGVIGVEKDTTFYVAKEAINASGFIPKLKGLPISTCMWNSGKAYIGHNRKKTIGSISDETAHPFVVDGTFAMVHNGTLTGYQKLAKDCAVDSQALAIHLHAALKAGMAADKSDASTIEDALGEVHGAYAVAIYDQTRHKVFLTRNKERPLSVIETDDAYYFMSELAMGTWVLSRNGYPIDKMQMNVLDEHELITFDLDKHTMKSEKLSVKKQTSYLVLGSSTLPNTTSSGDTAARKVGSPCDDRDFRRFRREWIGKRVTVKVDDLLEEHYPDERLEWGNAKVLKLFAQHPNFFHLHSITFSVDVEKENIKSAEDVLGKSYSISLDTISLGGYGSIHIDGSDPVKLQGQVLKLNGAKTNKEFRANLAKLCYEELHAMSEELRFTGATWEINAVKSEISWRDSNKSLEDAARKASSKGIVLTQTRKDGKFIYHDSEGNVYYECAIALQ